MGGYLKYITTREIKLFFRNINKFLKQISIVDEVRVRITIKKSD